MIKIPRPPKEIQLKQWCHEEAAREGVTVTTIYNRFYRGKYKHLNFRRVGNHDIRIQVT
jgi:hypothetical protein